jgi:hypothetical protein
MSALFSSIGAVAFPQVFKRVFILRMHNSFLGALVLLTSSILIIFIFTSIVIVKFSFHYIGRVVIFIFTKVAEVCVWYVGAVMYYH